MAKKASVRFVCSNCGAMTAAWAGRCPQCGEWNTLQEEAVLATVPVGGGKVATTGTPLKSASIAEVTAHDQPRIPTGLHDVDTVLGGGLVPGSVVLLAGQPGIGKSTLLLQLTAAVAAKRRVLYVSAEESQHQVGLRASRLGSGPTAAARPTLQLDIAASISADDIAATIAGGTYPLVIVDSIQTVACSAVGSAPGTVSQITNSTNLLMQAAKQSGCALIIVGHVTKEGSIAGPKLLEHVVDVVLQLEGDRYGGFKILRAVKNRYGSTNEAGIFEMGDRGLLPVDNPSAALLAERQASDGSVVLATIEGSRPLLVEVQALVNRTNYGYPKRTASGIDLNRLNVLVAVLEKRTKLQLADQDIFINIVGGMRISEPAADLAVCMAIGSAARGLQLEGQVVVFGEVGLAGEVRHVPFADKRLAEAYRLGFDSAIGPRIGKSAGKSVAAKQQAELQTVADVRGALNHFLKKS